MNIFFKKNRNQYIESLEFFYFLQKLLFSLKSRYGKSINPLILDFLNVLEIFYSWESKKIYPYIRSLTDQVFWKSSKFYRETMREFVNGELNVLEFAEKFSDHLLADKEKANNLVEDLQKQANIELNPDIFEFSKIILDFELILEVYQNEIDDYEIDDYNRKESCENNLSFTQDSILQIVIQALEKSEKYFTD